MTIGSRTGEEGKEGKGREGKGREGKEIRPIKVN
jgi:hypothetical protein